MMKIYVRKRFFKICMLIMICAGLKYCDNLIYERNELVYQNEEYADRTSELESKVTELKDKADGLSNSLRIEAEKNRELESATKDGISKWDINVFELKKEILGLEGMVQSEGTYDLSKVDKGHWLYYNKLSEKEKEAYISILISLFDMKSEICYEELGINEDAALKILKFVNADMPTLFWYNMVEFEVEALKIVYIEEYIDSVELYNYWYDIKEYRDKALRGISDFDSDFTKELHIFNYIVRHTEYETTSGMNQSIVSVLNEESVCAGMAKMFKFLCDSAEVECVCVFGKSNSSGVGHLWNMVKLEDGSYGMVDVTNGGINMDMDKYSGLNYDFLNCNAELMERYYTILYKSFLP